MPTSQALVLCLCVTLADVLAADEAAAVRLRNVEIDGTLDEWRRTVAVPLTSRANLSIDNGWEGPADLSAVAYLAWSDEALWFAIRVLDDAVHVGDTASRDFVGSDYVRLYLDTRGDGGSKLGLDDYCFVFTAPAGGDAPRKTVCPYEDGHEHSPEVIGAVRVAGRSLKDGYTLEAAIPFAALGQFQPRTSSKCGVQIVVGDSDSPGVRHHEMTWQRASGAYWRTPSTFGELRFVAPKSVRELLLLAPHAVTFGADASVYSAQSTMRLACEAWPPVAADVEAVEFVLRSSRVRRTASVTAHGSVRGEWSVQLTDAFADGHYRADCTLVAKGGEAVATRSCQFEVRRDLARSLRRAIAAARINPGRAGGWPAIFAMAAEGALKEGRLDEARRLVEATEGSLAPLAATPPKGGGELRIDTRPYMIGTVLHGVSEQSSTDVARARLKHTRSGRVDWPARAGLKFVSSFRWHGLPPGRRKPLESNRGEQRQKLLFLDVNFNYPPFRQWLQDKMPALLQERYGAGESLLALCVANEFAYWAPGYYDYSEWTVAKYQQWLRSKYGQIGPLNRAWRTSHDSFEAIAPPRDIPTTQVANWVEWRTFTCWNFSEFFRFCGDLAHQVLPRVPVACNFCFTSSLDGWDLWELARQNDYLGFDIYAIGRWDRNTAGLDVLRSAAAAYGKPAYLLEYHAGPNNWAPVVDAEDMYVTTFQALAREIRLLTYYHWRPGGAGREQGIHGMTDSSGQPTERVTAAAECASFAQQIAHYLHSSRTLAEVAVLFSIPSRYRDVGLGKSHSVAANKALNVWKWLERLRIQSDFIEERQILRGDLRGYRVLVLPGTPMLSQEAGGKVADFVKAGGSVVMFPGVGAVDELGFAHERAPVGLGPATGVAWTGQQTRVSGRLDGVGMPSARFGGDCESLEIGKGAEILGQIGGRPAIVRARLGHGRAYTFAFWPEIDLPQEGLGDRTMLHVVQAVLADAGARPCIEIVAPAEANALGVRSFVETRMVEAAGSRLIFLINRSKKALADLRLRISGTEAVTALYLTCSNRAVERLEAFMGRDSLYVTVPQLGPAGLIVLPRCSQPLIGMKAPEGVAKGERVPVSVTLDNLSAETIGAELSLTGPPDWQIKPPGATHVSVPPGGRKEARFEVRVPPDCDVEHFRIRNVLKAQAELAQRQATLSCEQGVAVRPVLDVGVEYQGSRLNSYQELSPPLLRWGWGKEVLVPPPPALPLRAPATVILDIVPSAGTGGEMVVTGDGLSIAPGELPVPTGPARVPITVTGQRSGATTLTIVPSVAGAFPPVHVPVRVEVTEASLAPLLTSQRQVAIGVATGNARGDLVAIEPAVTEIGGVIAPDGTAVPFERVGQRIRLPVVLDKDGTARYELRETATDAGPLFAYSRAGNGAVSVRCPLYEIRFDRLSGCIEGILVKGRRVLGRGALAVVGTDQRSRFDQSRGHDCESLSIDCRKLTARVEVKGSLAPAEADGTYEIVCDATPARINVRVRLRNSGKAPVCYRRAYYQVLRPTGSRVDGEAEDGSLDRRLRVNHNLRRYRDLLIGDGGLGVGWLVYYARTRWSDGFSGWAETPFSLRLNLKSVAPLDPGQALDCKFEWVPHAQALGVADLLPPRIVTALPEPR